MRSVLGKLLVGSLMLALAVFVGSRYLDFDLDDSMTATESPAPERSPEAEQVVNLPVPAEADPDAG